MLVDVEALPNFGVIEGRLVYVYTLGMGGSGGHFHLLFLASNAINIRGMIVISRS